MALALALVSLKIDSTLDLEEREQVSLLGFMMVKFRLIHAGLVFADTLLKKASRVAIARTAHG